MLLLLLHLLRSVLRFEFRVRTLPYSCNDEFDSVGAQPAAVPAAEVAVAKATVPRAAVVTASPGHASAAIEGVVEQEELPSSETHQDAGFDAREDTSTWRCDLRKHGRKLTEHGRKLRERGRELHAHGRELLHKGEKKRPDFGVFPVTELEDHGSWAMFFVRILILHTILFLAVVCPFALFPVLLTREDSYCIAQNTTGLIDLYTENCTVNMVSQTRNIAVLERDLFGSPARSSRLEIVVSASAEVTSVLDSVSQAWPRLLNMIRSGVGQPVHWTGGLCSTAGANGSVAIFAAPGPNTYIPCAITVRLPVGTVAFAPRVLRTQYCVIDISQAASRTIRVRTLETASACAARRVLRWLSERAVLARAPLALRLGIIHRL